MADTPTMPSRAEAEHVFRQFFRLIERFEAAGALQAPEMKASLRRKARMKRTGGKTAGTQQDEAQASRARR